MKKLRICRYPQNSLREKLAVFNLIEPLDFMAKTILRKTIPSLYTRETITTLLLKGKRREARQLFIKEAK